VRAPDWKIERLALGELSEDEARALGESSAPAVEALRRDDAAILFAHPPGAVAAEVARRAGHSGPRLGLLWALFPAAAALALVLVLVPRGPVPDGGETITEKGSGPTLRVYRRAAGAVERLAGGSRVHAGDQLRLATVGAGTGVLVSIDGRGGVTLHLPPSGDAPAHLAGGEAPLPDAYELDDAPGFERFVLVTGEAARPDAVLAAARRLASDPARARKDPLPLPGSLHQFSLLLVKENP
jgi:hypothetical protein